MVLATVYDGALGQSDVSHDATTVLHAVCVRQLPCHLDLSFYNYSLHASLLAADQADVATVLEDTKLFFFPFLIDPSVFCFFRGKAVSWLETRISMIHPTNSFLLS